MPFISLANSHNPAPIVCLVRRPLPLGTDPFRPPVLHVRLSICQYRIANYLCSQKYIFCSSPD